MTAILSQLLDQRAQLEATAAPLRERLQRCDDAIAEADNAQQHRDRLLEQHDRTVADCIANGRQPPPIDPELDAAEIALRRRKSDERGALIAREQVQEQLAAINARLSTVAAELDEQTWAVVPAAAAHLFAAAESARIEFEKALAAINSVSSHAFEQAHQRANGGSPQSTAAYRCYTRIAGMTRALTAALGANARRDFVTGPDLLAAISDCRAEFGDVSRWLPPSQAAPDGSHHFNRAPQPLGEPAERGLPNPATLTPDAAECVHASAQAVSGAG